MKIYSEIRPLKKVIVHRPNLSFNYLTEENCQAFLFDQVLSVEKAVEEHRFFTKALQNCGVDVYFLHDLLSDVLKQAVACEWLISQTLYSTNYPENIKILLKHYLNSIDPHQLANYFLGGLVLNNIDDAGLAKLFLPHLRYPPFIFAPLLNHLFARDASCWIGGGVAINQMYHAIRQREAVNMTAIYRFHSLFKGEAFSIWYEGGDSSQHLPSLEGGDVLVISENCVLIGLSQRTSFQAALLLAKALFQQQAVKQIIVVDIPKKRACIHLDAMITMVDDATFCLAFPIDCYAMRSWSIVSASGKNLHISPLDNFLSALEQALKVAQLQWITPSGDDATTKREQWRNAANLLAIAPGKVIGYDCNDVMNRQLSQAGIEVIDIPGRQLSRGHGGPRCMTCPIER